jgi:hypothetical protein
VFKQQYKHNLIGSQEVSLALKNTKHSATLIPNIATNTLPSEKKPVKIITILEKFAKKSPVNMLFNTTASAVQGSIALKVKFDNITHSYHIINKQNKK